MQTQKTKLLRALTGGAQLTAKQIRTLYRIASPSKVASRLRNDDGVPVVCRPVATAKGKTLNKYMIEG